MLNVMPSYTCPQVLQLLIDFRHGMIAAPSRTRQYVWLWRSAAGTIRSACPVHVVGRPAANQAKSSRRPKMHHDSHAVYVRRPCTKALTLDLVSLLTVGTSFCIMGDVLRQVCCCLQWTTQCGWSCSSHHIRQPWERHMTCFWMMIRRRSMEHMPKATVL